MADKKNNTQDPYAAYGGQVEQQPTPQGLTSAHIPAGHSAMTDPQGRLQVVPFAERQQKMQQGWQLGPPEQQHYSAPSPTQNPAQGTAYEGYARLGEGVKDAGRALVNMPGQIIHAFSDAPQTPEEKSDMSLGGPGALGVKRLIVDPSVAEFQKSKDAFSQGHYSEAAGHAVGTVPIIGPFAAHSGEAIGQDPLRGIGELGTNLLVGELVPKIAGGIVKGTLKYGADPALAVSKVLHPTATPTELLTRALKPSVTVPDFENSVTNALPDLHKANPKISSVQDVADAARTGAQAKNAEYQNLLTPLKNDTLDASPVGYAQMNSIPLTQQIETPGIYDATRAKASAYMQPMPVGDLDTLRVESNAKLQDMLSAPGSDQAAILRSNPEAARVNATRSTTRDLVYDHIKDQTGVDPAPIQNSYGDLATVRDVADKRSVVFGRQDPTSLSEKIGALAGPKGFIASKIMKNAGGSDTLARLAFDRYGNSLPATPSIASPGDFVNPIVFGSLLSQDEDKQQPVDEDPYKDYQ